MNEIITNTATVSYEAEGHSFGDSASARVEVTSCDHQRAPAHLENIASSHK